MCSAENQPASVPAEISLPCMFSDGENSRLVNPDAGRNQPTDAGKGTTENQPVSRMMKECEVETTHFILH
jgi:hypothetical protein